MYSLNDASRMVMCRWDSGIDHRLSKKILSLRPASFDVDAQRSLRNEKGKCTSCSLQNA